MIRPTIPGDHLALEEIAQRTGFFKAGELKALGEVLRDFPTEQRQSNHQCVTYEGDGEILGFAYYAPSSMADRAWYLYWIAVDRAVQGLGIGRLLMEHVETAIRDAQGGRLFLIETSSQILYEPTRRFYRSLGFEVGSILEDFYADGDDLVIFTKRLALRLVDREVPFPP